MRYLERLSWFRHERLIRVEAEMRAVLVLTHPVRRFEIRETVHHPHEKVMSFYLGPHTPKSQRQRGYFTPKRRTARSVGNLKKQKSVHVYSRRSLIPVALEFQHKNK